jgi:hypothetical protein
MAATNADAKTFFDSMAECAIYIEQMLRSVGQSLSSSPLQNLTLIWAKRGISLLAQARNLATGTFM